MKIRAFVRPEKSYHLSNIKIRKTSKFHILMRRESFSCEVIIVDIIHHSPLSLPLNRRRAVDL